MLLESFVSLFNYLHTLPCFFLDIFRMCVLIFIVQPLILISNYSSPYVIYGSLVLLRKFTSQTIPVSTIEKRSRYMSIDSNQKRENRFDLVTCSKVDRVRLTDLAHVSAKNDSFSYLRSSVHFRKDLPSCKKGLSLEISVTIELQDRDIQTRRFIPKRLLWTEFSSLMKILENVLSIGNT